MKAQQNVIFGINAILEKLKASPSEIAEILLSGSSNGAIEREAGRLGVRVIHESRETLDRFASGERHQGAVAMVTEFRYSPIDELLHGALSPTPPRCVLILDGVTDPRNLGALLRAADGAGAPYVVIPKDRSAGITPSAIKASAGAAHHVKISKVTNIRRAMKQLKERGFWLVALDARAKTSIYDANYPEKLGIVLGSEGHGIRPLILRECDLHVSIPMAGRIESLNVAVAGAVFLYEVHRRHRHMDVDKDRAKI